MDGKGDKESREADCPIAGASHAEPCGVDTGH